MKHMLEYFRRVMLYGINAIIWTIFRQQHWIVRRFYLDHNLDNISQEALQHSLDYANEINKDRNKLVVCCDLTTFMHVGDVVLVETYSDQRSIRIAELKEGKTNEKCLDVLQQFQKTQCPANLYHNTQDFSKKEKTQLSRIMRQEWRMANVSLALSGKDAHDISTEQKLHIPDEEYIIDSWDDVVIKMFEKIEGGKTWAIDVISDCLFVGLYSDKIMGKYAFDIWLEGIGFYGIKLNYLSALKSPLAKPPFCLLWPGDLILRIVKSDIWLMMALDVPKWIEGVNKKYPDFLKLESKKKSKKVNAKKGVLIEFQHRLILSGQPAKQAYLGTGILGKVFYDFNSPIDIMRPMVENL
jgi:hypothetical protein